MPIYEYRCKGCDREFEKYVVSAAATVACPACASSQVMRKLSVFGLRSSAASQVATAMPAGGGCCGGGCSCQ